MGFTPDSVGLCLQGAGWCQIVLLLSMTRVDRPNLLRLTALFPTVLHFYGDDVSKNTITIRLFIA